MKKLLAVLLCLGLVGCAAIKSLYIVSVDSINNKEALVGKKCIVLPAEKDVKIDNLQFREYATYVARALELKGYIAGRLDRSIDSALDK